MTELTILASTICLSIWLSTFLLFRGIGKMGQLGGSRPMPGSDSATSPLISIIIPACNEEENIAESLQNIIKQTYQSIEIIVINDRSIDGTAEVLDKLASDFPQLQVYHNNTLPKGWMGKSHALHLGARHAKGEYLLFTDADVLLEKTSLQRAMNHMQQNDLDHLTCLFKNISPGWLLNSLIADSSLGLIQLFRPWLLKDNVPPQLGVFVGIGAFNMMKRSVYQTIGGHESIKMHPVDDMMLGKMIRDSHSKQDCLLAYDFVQIPWYDSVSAMANGLQKNIFAIVHYRTLLIPLVLLAVVTTHILPLWGALLASGVLKVFCVLAVLGRLVWFSKGLRMMELEWYYLPACLITPYISCYIFLKAAYVTVKDGGIRWRGQFYSLSELKKTRPLLF